MLPETHLLRALDGEAGRADHERLLVVAWDTLHTRLGDLYLSPELILQEFRKHSPTPEGLLTAVMRLWAMRAGKPVAGEKTPAHLPYTGRILEGIPRSRAVILMRDGRAVVAAMRRTRRHADTPIDRLVNGWIAAARSTAEWMDLYPSRARLVRFEELVTQPEETLRALLKWLEADFEAGVLEPRPTETYRRWEIYAKRDVTRPIMPEKADSWREGAALLSSEQLGRLAPWLLRFGYRAEVPVAKLAPQPEFPVHGAGSKGGGRRRPLSRPPLVIVGAARAGCGSLMTWLSSHPEIVSADSQRPRLVLDWPLTSREYLDRSGESISGGRSAPACVCHAASYYFAHPDLPRRLKLVSPDARILVILRNPVLRAYSHWIREWRMGTEELPFAEALEAEPARLGNSESDLAADEQAVRFNHLHYSYALQGRYWTHLARWYHAFPAEQIMVQVLGEVLRGEQTTWDGLCRHAGVSAGSVAPAFPRTESVAWPLSRGAVIRSAAARMIDEVLRPELEALGSRVNLGALHAC